MVGTHIKYKIVQSLLGNSLAVPQNVIHRPSTSTPFHVLKSASSWVGKEERRQEMKKEREETRKRAKKRRGRRRRKRRERERGCPL